MPEVSDGVSSRRKTRSSSRPDSVSRIARKQTTICSVVKMSWAQFCKPAAECLDIGYALLNVNKTTFEASLFANFHIARLLDGRLPIPKVDQDFFYKCCSAVSQSLDRRQKPPADEDFALSLSIYESWRPESYRPAASDYPSAGSFIRPYKFVVTWLRAQVRHKCLLSVKCCCKTNALPFAKDALTSISLTSLSFSRSFFLSSFSCARSFSLSCFSFSNNMIVNHMIVNQAKIGLSMHSWCCIQ